MIYNEKVVQFNYNNLISIAHGFGVLRVDSSGAGLDCFYLSTTYSIINLGGNGIISVEGESYHLDRTKFTFQSNVSRIVVSHIIFV